MALSSHHHFIVISPLKSSSSAVGLARLGLASPLGSEERSQQRERTSPRSIHRPCQAFQTPGRGPQSGCRVKEPPWKGTSPKEKGRGLGWGGVSSQRDAVAETSLGRRPPPSRVDPQPLGSGAVGRKENSPQGAWGSWRKEQLLCFITSSQPPQRLADNWG